MTMTRRRLMDDTFKKTVIGNPAIATDSLARMHPGITMQGWTEQAKTTGAQLLDESTIEQGFINGNTGEETDSADMCRSGFIPIKPNTQYYLSGQYRNWVIFYDSSQTFLSSQSAVSIVSPENAAYMKLRWFNTSGDLSPQDVIAGKPMLNEGTTALPYEPYTGGQPSPSPDYPQEIVSAGKYNEETGRYEYEITIANEQTDPDKNQTVTLTSDRPLTKWDKLEKRNGQWGWVYGSVEADMSSEVTWVIHQGYEQETSNLFRGAMSGVDKIDSTDRVFCNILPYRQTSSVDVNGIYPLSNYLFARIVGIKSLEDFQERIQGGKVLAKLSIETFVPLAAAEQEAMEALHTYRPTTVLRNEQDCDMTLTYKTRKGMS